MTAKNSFTVADKRPSKWKLGASLIYEMLVITALCFASALMFIAVMGDATHGIKRELLQFFLWLSVGLYYVRCWSVRGQTLAMHTWRIQLVNHENAFISVRLAILRYLLATLSLGIFGLGFLWALLDRDGLFLHDKILNLSIQQLPPQR